MTTKDILTFLSSFLIVYSILHVIFKQVDAAEFDESAESKLKFCYIWSIIQLVLIGTGLVGLCCTGVVAACASMGGKS